MWPRLEGRCSRSLRATFTGWSARVRIALTRPHLLLLALLAPALLNPGRGQDAARAQRDAVWIIEQGTRRLGHCASSYVGEEDLGGRRARHYREQVELELGAEKGVTQRYTVELWTDERAHPLRFDFRVQIADVRSSVEGTFAGGKASLVVRQGTSEQPVSVDKVGEAFFLANNFVSELEPVLALDPAAETRTLSLFSANALAAFPYTLKRTGEKEGATLFEDSLGERLELSADGRLTRVEIPAQGIVIRRTDEPVERFTIEKPSAAVPGDFEREEVKIQDGEVTLAGTITRPKASAGRLPAVTFLSGSGPQDREGFSSGIDLGTHEILDRLTREGFLVLRVDDRGVGASTGPVTDFDLQDIIEDGRRMVRYLRGRPDVDPARVALIGHSEGGVTAPVLAAEEPVAAVVLMAAPGRPLEELLREQLLAGRKRQGAKPEELEVFGQEIDGFVEAIATGEALAKEGLPPELAVFLPARAWLESHVGRDPLPFLRQVRCPILVLQGESDVQVSAERDLPRLEAALADHPDHELRLFPGLDHLFKRASDPPSELDYLKKRPVDPEFLDVLAGWLRAHLMQ